MSAPHHSESFLERHWYWFVIAFGAIFIACLDFFAPTH